MLTRDTAGVEDTLYPVSCLVSYLAPGIIYENLHWSGGALCAVHPTLDSEKKI